MSDPIAEEENREVALCPGCLTPIPPHEYFCEKCGLPLTSAATTLPMERIRSTGEMIRRGYDRPKPIVLIGVWLIFGPPAVILIFLIFWFPVQPPRTLNDLPFAALSIVLELGSVVMLCSILWRTTSRFITAQPVAESEEGESEVLTGGEETSSRSDD